MPKSTLERKLIDRLGPAAVLGDGDMLGGYLEDWRGRFRGPATCVVLPSSTEDVAAIVHLCAEHGTPVLPQGGNTSLCGGSVPADAGASPVIVNLQRMRAIRVVDAANHSMIVDAGCTLVAVQQAAVDAGRLYPVSVGSEGSCQIGGTIATNAGGTSVLRYGNTRDNVLGLEVVLPDGRIWDGLTVLRKNNTGFDLKQLFIGAEGTLGIVTGAALKLHPLPTAQATAWIAPRDPAAALAVLDLVKSRAGARLSAFEMIDGHQLALVLTHLPDRRNPLPGPIAPWNLLIELADAGDAAELDEALLDVLEAASSQGLCEQAVVCSTGAQRERMWQVRHSVSEANKKEGVGLTTDCAVPVSAVPDFIDGAVAAVRALYPQIPVAVVAHLGDGNVHFIPFFTFERWAALPDRDAVALAVGTAVNDVAHALGGTFSAEHGVGRTHLDEMSRYKSPVELDAMRSIKHAFDPQHLFNPGRVLPPAPKAPTP